MSKSSQLNALVIQRYGSTYLTTNWKKMGKAGKTGKTNRTRFLSWHYFVNKQVGAQKRVDTRPKCVVTMNLNQAEQPVAVGTKFGPQGPSQDLWAPKRDILGQNWPFWGP